MPTYRVVTLGCKVSRADAASVERGLIGAGFDRARDGERAEVCVICGCAVTGVAEGKSRRAIRRAARENEGATVVAAGCIAAREEASRAGGAEVFLPPGRMAELADRLRAAGWAIPAGGNALESRAPGERAAAAAGFPGRTRAFLKVQDGCDGACAYCIVPALRGMPTCLSLEEAADEARGLVRAGHAEIVLAGIRLGSYRDPASGSGLVEFVEALLMLEGEGLRRLRLSSIEPMDLDLRLAEIASENPALCPHFHLPLQSASDGVLARMRRPYRVEDYRTLLARVRGFVPDAAVTTDVIAGFPGETEGDHARTLDFVREAGFARVHAFPFSPRPGTPAAEMPREPGVEEARRRADQLTKEGASVARGYRSQFVGLEVEVLAEPGGADGRLAGYTERYVRVGFAGPPGFVGRVVCVRPRAETGSGLEGEVVT